MIRRCDHRKAVDMESGTFKIGQWTVHPTSLTLEGPNGTTRLEARSMALLVALAEAGGEVVSRDKLLDIVWPDVTVTDHSVSNTISNLRKALADTDRDNRLIETIPKRGYRLNQLTLASTPPAAQPETSTAPWPVWKRLLVGSCCVVLLVAILFLWVDGSGTPPAM